MQYLLLIYHNEVKSAKENPANQEIMYQEYGQLIQQLSAAGKYVGGHQLKPTGTATTVRMRDGKRLVTDGPFAETKEQLGGYFLVNASDLDEAIAIAAKIPSARDGSIEVRPVVVGQNAKSA
ncbi:MAG: YciI family protein [Candidatus Acidiferrales bacterium]